MIERKKNFIDFSILTAKELDLLSQRWEKDAQLFEEKLERFRFNIGSNIPVETQEKLNRLWNTGNSLWRRLSILERWRLKNKTRKVK